MPNFASPFHFTPALIKTAPMGALLLPLDPVKETHLVAAVNDIDAIVQLDGAHAFSGEPRDGNYDGEIGLAVDAFEIEADLSSAYDPQANPAKEGDLQICSVSNEARIVILAPDGKTKHRAVFIAPSAGKAKWVGYSVWRFIKYNNAGDAIVVFDKP